MQKESRSIVFYDGDCGFCNRTVQFVLSNNRKKNVYFAALQSEFSESFFKGNSNITPDLSTFYFYDGKKLYDRSTAGLKLSQQLRFPFPLMILFWIVPKGLRDLFYNMIAKRRHRINRGFCVIPNKEDSSRFIR